MPENQTNGATRGLRRVLFLSANMGTGHSAAAENVLEALKRANPNVTGIVVNSFQYAHSLVGKVVEDGYIQVLKFLPTLYGALYEPREKPGPMAGMRQWINGLLAPTFKTLIDDYRPDVVVCTHAFPAGICSVLQEKYDLKIPVMGVVTDFVVHPFWISKFLDMYTVATPELASLILSRGVARDRVQVTGIPIDPRFSRPFNRDALREKLQLDPNLPVVLVMGGGLGLEPVGRILTALKRVRIDMHVVIFTGKNKRLEKRLAAAVEKAGPLPARIRVLSYIDNVHEYMQTGDLLVTKPGGLTSSEALAVGLPMLIVQPLPGQEARNTKFLVSRKVALKVSQERQLSQAIEQMIVHRVMLDRMKSRARALGCPDSAAGVAAAVQEVVQRKSGLAMAGVTGRETLTPF